VLYTKQVRSGDLDPLGRIERPVPLAQQAHESIRRELISGRWGPEERLTEEQVARRLSISRTPAREALRMLVMSGSLDTVPGGGYAQRTLTKRAVREHCELRLLLEPEAAALTAARPSADLEALLESVELRGPAVDPARDMRFHVAVAEASGNAALAGLVRTLNERAAVYRLCGDPGDEDVGAQVAEGHRQVVQAVEAHDAPAAFAAMHEHLRAEADVLLDFPGP
jgi:DNA-binding GntR family transcriptional regulator